MIPTQIRPTQIPPTADAPTATGINQGQTAAKDVVVVNPTHPKGPAIGIAASVKTTAALATTEIAAPVPTLTITVSPWTEDQYPVAIQTAKHSQFALTTS
mmetsp:Transcript_19619/g.26931  ORF Transcript_19619/g.26931 Transcript_19619/m.26931 type:complete len:100 (-) Transcript_19619:702-1001(-)